MVTATTFNALQSTELMSDDSYIPTDLLASLKEVHNSMVGHFGVELTLQRVVARGHSEKYLVRRFIQSCPHCQKLEYLSSRRRM